MAEQQRLTLDQAYQAAYLWLDHAGDPPMTISESSHGAVELITERLFVRVRSSDGPVEQSSVLALLRAAEAGKRLLIFSPSGFSAGAVSIAETQGIALFSLDSTGRANAETTHARAIAPATEPVPPFAPVEGHGNEDGSRSGAGTPFSTTSDSAAEEIDDTIDVGTFDWTDCPSCGTTHHRNAKFCRECGTNLVTAVSSLADEGETRVTSVPHEDGTAKLRCRTCGSHDIELIE